jgi:hypothetical protein
VIAEAFVTGVGGGDWDGTRRLNLADLDWSLAWDERLPQPIAMVGLVAIGGLLLAYHNRISLWLQVGLAFLIGWGFWLWGGVPLLKLLVIFGGLAWLIRSASLLSTGPWLFALLSYSVILNTGLTVSLERYVYGVAPMLLVFADQLSRRSWSPGLLVASAIPLAELSIRFARYLWVA